MESSYSMSMRHRHCPFQNGYNPKYTNPCPGFRGLPQQFTLKSKLLSQVRLGEGKSPWRSHLIQKLLKFQNWCRSNPHQASESRGYLWTARTKVTQRIQVRSMGAARGLAGTVNGRLCRVQADSSLGLSGGPLTKCPPKPKSERPPSAGTTAYWGFPLSEAA